MSHASHWTERKFDVPGLPAIDDQAFETQWQRLHQGDKEAAPTLALVEKRLQDHPDLLAATQKSGASDDPKALSAALLQAWQDFHGGRFREAREAGLGAGPLGLVVAGKASNIYATYLCVDEKEKLAVYQEVADWGEQLVSLLPLEDGGLNALYMQAYALGRYSQLISITKALKEGLATRVKQALETVLDTEPEHAEAHTALGLYHAELIDKVGGMLAKLTYGASKDQGVRHFDQSLEIAPFSAIARIEYANGLLMMFGDKKLDQATKLYVEASEASSEDAMEALDIELAKSELED
jgi:tetratricopeptide (TPR) repeat protein